MCIFKKIIAVALVLCMSLPLLATTFAAEIDAGAIIQPVQPTANSLEEIDALLVACSVLNSPDAEDDILISENTEVARILPLYSESGEAIAYYVSFAPTGYAVVNNSRSNPTVVEFGEGNQSLIEDILCVDSNSCIIYNNPTEVYAAGSLNAAMQATVNQEESVDLYSYYPSLEEENTLAAASLAQLKQAMEIPENSTHTTGDYGFIDLSDMPSGTYSWDIIEDADWVDWVTTGEFSSIARDHCAATAITNIALYYAYRGYSNLKINNNADTFIAVYAITGSGPFFGIADQSKEYFSDRGYTLQTSGIGVFAEIVIAVNNNRPSGILIANNVLDWHWIVCVGYRQYDSGGDYMRIVDGQVDSIDRFYLVNSGSMWLSATECRMG